MIVGGHTNPNAGALGAYLMRKGENEKVALLEIKGLLSDNAKAALYEMEAIAKGTRCEAFAYSAHIDPAISEHLSHDQKLRAVEILAEELGMKNHQRVVVEHIKEGRAHIHIAFNRIDTEKMKAADIWKNYIAHERAKVRMEKEFSLEHVQGAHIDKDGQPLTLEQKRNRKKAPHRSQVLKGKETGFRNPYEVRDEINAIKEQADSGKAFAAALEEKGLVLAKGSKRDFVIVDQGHGETNLTRCLHLRVAELRAFLADVGPLPSVEQGHRIQEGRAAAQDVEPQKLEALDIHRAANQITKEKGHAMPEGLARAAAAITKKKEPDGTGPAHAVKASELRESPDQKPQKLAPQGQPAAAPEKAAVGKEELFPRGHKARRFPGKRRAFGGLSKPPRAIGGAAKIAAGAVNALEGVLDFLTGGAQEAPEKKQERAAEQAAARTEAASRARQAEISREIMQRAHDAAEREAKERRENERKGRACDGYERER